MGGKGEAVSAGGGSAFGGRPLDCKAVRRKIYPQMDPSTGLILPQRTLLNQEAESAVGTRGKWTANCQCFVPCFTLNRFPI